MMKLSAIAMAAMALASAAPAGSDPRDLAALKRIEPGQWMLVSREGPMVARRLCVVHPDSLIQIEHGGETCKRFVIRNEAGEATVHYSCADKGHGHTAIRVESARLAQIDTQGIVSGAPFAMRFEARRTGDCPTVTGMKPR